MKHLKFSLLFLMCMLAAVPVSAKKKTKVIAHRGYWKTEGSAQNSIRSLERANEIKVYGSEFDVHLTADNVPVVFHDNKIQGKNIQTTPYAELKDLKLPNGETLPTLEQYLDKAKTLKKTKLIFELKSHATPQRDREAAKIVTEMVNGKKLTKRTEYIAFSLEAAKELHRLSPKTPVYYLNGDLSPKQLKELGFTGLDYYYKVMQKHPEWFAEAKDLKLKINVWTVDDPKVMKEMIENQVDFLTTDYPEEAQKAVYLHR
ncbi:MAG: glycerophosphodiester phosphodiesterase [Parabacteroides sp.]|nr:glycerophosphodiester phosphodiesterase [Parabacteroides sp.]